MTLELALDQGAPSGRIIDMEHPKLTASTRAFARRLQNRLVQAVLNRRVASTLAALADPPALAREIARWRALRTWSESASMPHGSVEAIQVAAPQVHGLQAPPVPSDWFAPLRGETKGFVFYVHGGSFIFDRSPALTELVMRFAAGAGARVIAPNYRLAPEHPCPAAVDDIVAALRWLRAAWPSTPVVALAESAGASILLAALQTLRDQGDEMPDGVMLLSPWVDLTLQSWSVISTILAGGTGATMPVLAMMAHLYLNERSAGDPLASPLFGDFRGFPPMLIHASRGDMLCDDAIRLADKVRDDGGDLTVRLWLEDAHVFEKSNSAKAGQSIRLASDFIRRRLL